MKKTQIEVEEEIFSRAVEIKDEAQREVFLKKETNGNRQLETKIQRLLDFNNSNHSFLDDSTVTNDLLKNSLHELENVGDKIGEYELIRQIGEGGMGTVFLARQSFPLQRQVAIKVLKHSGQSSIIAQRFEMERQTLALMNHPNVTRIIDGGITPKGHPYFVMEYINGQNILDYCSKNKCDLETRIQLIKEIALALHHAHLRGIIHRDIKPDNILIEESNGQPVPKVIDFGIARITDQNQPDNRFTYHGQLIGTLHYMSPEQLGGNIANVDARTDVYSLGSVLYKLLTSRTPFEESIDQKNDNLFKVIRSIESAVIAAPSKMKKDSQLAFSAEKLKGEIDWITMKALEKEPSRRYDSANEFGQDLQNFLDGNVVNAAQPSVWYRLQKSFRKHTAGFLFSGVIIILLIVMAIGGNLLALQANSARKLAEQRLEEAKKAKIAEENLRAVAEKERDRARIAEAESKSYSRKKQMELVDSRSRAAIFQSSAFRNLYRLAGEKIAKEMRFEKAVELIPAMSLPQLPFDSNFTKLLDDRIRKTVISSTPIFYRDNESLRDDLPYNYRFKKIDVSQLESADSILLEAMENRHKNLTEILDADDLTVAKESEELAVVYLSRNKVEEAKDLLKNANKIRQLAVNKHHIENTEVEILQCTGLLGVCLLMNQEIEDGQKLVRQALETPVSNNLQLERFRKNLKFLLNQLDFRW